MADQPLNQLNPTGTVVRRLKKTPNREPIPPGNGNKEQRLRNLLNGVWLGDDIGLIAWNSAQNRWYKWDHLA